MIGENARQFGGHAGRIDHMLGLDIKRIGRKVGRQDAAIAVGDIGALRH